jgi:hypothetical protein
LNEPATVTRFADGYPLRRNVVFPSRLGPHGGATRDVIVAAVRESRNVLKKAMLPGMARATCDMCEPSTWLATASTPRPRATSISRSVGYRMIEAASVL